MKKPGQCHRDRQYPNDACRQDAGAPICHPGGADAPSITPARSVGVPPANPHQHTAIPSKTSDARPGSAGVPPAKPQQHTDAPPANNRHKGWYTRNRLPHCDAPGLIQAVTFRLADALPRAVLRRLATLRDETEKRRQIEHFMDAGLGDCVLADPRCAEIVEQALHYHDGDRYRLLAWCIMPNHVHVLIEPAEGVPLARILHAWKSFTAKRINRLLGRSGQLWQRAYYDRYIRNDHHLAAVIRYIHQNPVKAGLAATPEAWRFSSARLRR